MIRFFGSSAPGSGAGPAGQLAILRVPARTAEPKLVASILPRPGISFGEAESPAAGVDELADGDSADAFAAGVVEVVVVVDVVVVVVDEEVVEVESPAAGAGVATSPALAALRGASVAQAASAIAASADANELRSSVIRRDMMHGARRFCTGSRALRYLRSSSVYESGRARLPVRDLEREDGRACPAGRFR